MSTQLPPIHKRTRMTQLMIRLPPDVVATVKRMVQDYREQGYIINDSDIYRSAVISIVESYDKKKKLSKEKVVQS